MQINGSGIQVIEFLEEEFKKWGNRRYTYAAPFLPSIGRPPEYWCSDMVDWALKEVYGFNLAAYCPGFPSTIAAKAFYNASPYFITHDAYHTAPGDIFIMSRNGEAFHTGFRGVGDVVNNYVPTFEGDTSSPSVPGSDSMGGVLTSKRRYLPTYSGALSIHFWRPPYTGTRIESDSTANIETVSFPPAILSGLSKLFTCADDQRDVGKALQSHMNRFHGGQLTEDGLVGPLTVRALQGVLNHYGAHLDVDGLYGPHTAAALIAQIGKGTI